MTWESMRQDRSAELTSCGDLWGGGDRPSRSMESLASRSSKQTPTALLPALKAAVFPEWPQPYLRVQTTPMYPWGAWIHNSSYGPFHLSSTVLTNPNHN